MKKLLLCLTLLCSVFMITGCTSEKVTLNLKDLSTKLDTLKGNDFDRLTAYDLLYQKMENLMDIYDFNEINVNNENIEQSESSFAKNNDTKDMFIIVKPLDGKKETVKSEIDAYITKENLKDKTAYEEISNYLVYVVSNNNNELMKEVKNCKGQIFSSLMEVSDDLLTSQYGIEKGMVEEYLIKMPMMITSSNTYMIIKPTKGNKEAVKEKINTYMTNLEEQWKTYLPDQYELVQNRLEKEYGDYLIYIISKDNEKVFEEIKANNQK